jgi:branched-subunit amino acid aminotransferase/4-amino-4-deoxychorismate lyase
MIVYLNGIYLDGDAAVIPVWDGGYLYGDGVYTTLRLYRGRPVDLAAHCLRLRNHAAALELALDLTEGDFLAIARRLAAANGLEDTDGRLRITVSRSGGPDNPYPLEGYRDLPSTVLVTLTGVGAALDRWQTEGIPAIILGPSYARGNFPELKTLNSLPALRAQRRAAGQGCPEAILTDAEGHLLEGAVSNLFIVSRGSILTPELTGGFLAGRTRERILALAAAERIPVREEPLDRGHLQTADEVFMASSVREVLPVIRIDGAAVGGGAPGAVTRLIQDRYRRTMLAESSPA